MTCRVDFVGDRPNIIRSRVAFYPLPRPPEKQNKNTRAIDNGAMRVLSHDGNSGGRTGTHAGHLGFKSKGRKSCGNT
jgi:hypothetical protein